MDVQRTAEALRTTAAPRLTAVLALMDVLRAHEELRRADVLRFTEALRAAALCSAAAALAAARRRWAAVRGPLGDRLPVEAGAGVVERPLETEAGREAGWVAARTAGRWGAGDAWPRREALVLAAGVLLPLSHESEPGLVGRPALRASSSNRRPTARRVPLVGGAQVLGAFGEWMLGARSVGLVQALGVCGGMGGVVEAAGTCVEEQLMVVVMRSRGLIAQSRERWLRD